MKGTFEEVRKMVEIEEILMEILAQLKMQNKLLAEIVRCEACNNNVTSEQRINCFEVAQKIEKKLK